MEEKFNASAWDILCAIEKGFRAQVDVKGKLAEWFLFKVLKKLEEAGVFSNLEWSDKDGEPDFLLTGTGFKLKMECKNVSSVATYADGSDKLETQKTRNQKDAPAAAGSAAPAKKKGSRLYKVTEFDIVAACLFNQTGEWEYRFVRTTDLARSPGDNKYLKTMQKVPVVTTGVWTATIQEVLALSTRTKP